MTNKLGIKRGIQMCTTKTYTKKPPNEYIEAD